MELLFASSFLKLVRMGQAPTHPPNQPIEDGTVPTVPSSCSIWRIIVHRPWSRHTGDFQGSQKVITEDSL
jgi:hypothetical protein